MSKKNTDASDSRYATNEELVQLQIKIAFLEQNHQQLSDVVADLQKDYSALSKSNKALMEKLGSIVGDEIHPEIEKPPHY